MLASGGIDSSALIDFYLRRKASVLCVHFQYGQASDKSERASMERICGHYEVDYKVLDLDFPMAKRREELVFRNLLFILAACSLKEPPMRVALGIHAGTSYYGCSRLFLRDCQKILDGYFSGTAVVEAPFIEYTKADIISYSRENNVPLDLTYSCLVQNDPPCGGCSACRDRQRFINGDSCEHQKSM